MSETSTLAKIMDKLQTGQSTGSVETADLLNITLNGKSPILKKVSSEEIAKRTEKHGARETPSAKKYIDENGLPGILPPTE